MQGEEPLPHPCSNPSLQAFLTGLCAAAALAQNLSLRSGSPGKAVDPETTTTTQGLAVQPLGLRSPRRKPGASAGVQPAPSAERNKWRESAWRAGCLPEILGEAQMMVRGARPRRQQLRALQFRAPALHNILLKHPTPPLERESCISSRMCTVTIICIPTVSLHQLIIKRIMFQLKADLNKQTLSESQ